ncbi:MAG: hypothetical protein V3U60_11855 [Gammaproteobacteria bacterium]
MQKLRLSVFLLFGITCLALSSAQAEVHGRICPKGRGCVLITYRYANPYQMEQQILPHLMDLEKMFSKDILGGNCKSEVIDEKRLETNVEKKTLVEHWLVDRCGKQFAYRIVIGPNPGGGVVVALWMPPEPVALDDLPKAPNGYAWVKILKGRSALLKPNGWFVKEEQAKGTDAYFITKEDIEKNGSFSTGLSLHVVYDLATELRPSEYAEKAISEMKEAADKVLYSSKRSQRSLTSFWLRVKSTKPNKEVVIKHYFYVANDETKTLWKFVFESPAEEWKKAWKIGKKLTKKLRIPNYL